MLCLRILRKLRLSASKFAKPRALNLSKRKQGPTKSLPASSSRRALEKDRLMPRAPQTASLSFCPQWGRTQPVRLALFKDRISAQTGSMRLTPRLPLSAESGPPRDHIEASQATRSGRSRCSRVRARRSSLPMGWPGTGTSRSQFLTSAMAAGRLEEIGLKNHIAGNQTRHGWLKSHGQFWFQRLKHFWVRRARSPHWQW